MDTGRHTVRQGGSAADAPRPVRLPDRSRDVPVITERMPALGSGAADVPRTRRLLVRFLARPSLPALVGLAAVLAVFLPLAPELLTTGGLAGVLDTTAMIGIVAGFGNH